MFEKIERSIEEVFRKYLGISLPRICIGVLMLIFGILVIVFPALISWLIGLYLIIAGVLVIAEEYMRSKKFVNTSKDIS